MTSNVLKIHVFTASMESVLDMETLIGNGGLTKEEVTTVIVIPVIKVNIVMNRLADRAIPTLASMENASRKEKISSAVALRVGRAIIVKSTLKLCVIQIHVPMETVKSKWGVMSANATMVGPVKTVMSPGRDLSRLNCALVHVFL